MPYNGKKIRKKAEEINIHELALVSARATRIVCTLIYAFIFG